ncbi:MAG: S8 family serine peptidase [Myxococcota bacterium]
MSVLPLLSVAAAQELPTLYRVNVPDHPDALTHSATGSVLSAPPSDGTAFQIESLAEIDAEPAVDAWGDVVAWEALDAMNIRPWHAAGHDGSGVKVAVFDVQWFGADLDEAELGPVQTHDCFTHRSCQLPIDTLRPTFSFERGAHGVACAEVIRDIAPGVELHLVRLSGRTTLENAVRWAIDEEIDIIAMSLSFFNQSFYDGTGPVSRLMDTLADAGILMVTSAGNYADQHYRTDFKDDDRDGFHDFVLDERGLPVELNRGRSQIYLSWDQYGRCGDTDLDGFVTNAEGDVVGWSADPQDGDDDGCSPNERISAHAETAGTHYLRVRHAGGVPAVRFDVHARGAEIREPITENSITDPGAHPAVMTVGAVRATAYLSAPAEAFSSEGDPENRVLKPDVMGPNGLSSTVYGPTGFFGTSASTPAVAAAIALVMSADPSLSPTEAGARVVGWAARPEAGTTWSAPRITEIGRARLPDPDQIGDGCMAFGGGRAALLAPMVWLGWRRRRRVR